MPKFIQVRSTQGIFLVNIDHIVCLTDVCLTLNAFDRGSIEQLYWRDEEEYGHIKKQLNIIEPKTKPGTEIFLEATATHPSSWNKIDGGDDHANKKGP